MAPAFLDHQGDLEDLSDLVALNESETQVDLVVLSDLGGQNYPVDPVALEAPWAHEVQDVSAFLDAHVDPEAFEVLVEVPGDLQVLVVP